MLLLSTCRPLLTAWTEGIAAETLPSPVQNHTRYDKAKTLPTVGASGKAAAVRGRIAMISASMYGNIGESCRQR